MNINKDEVLRYLGYKNHQIDKNLNELIDSCIDEIKGIADPRYICNIFDVKVLKNEVQLLSSNLSLSGNDITNHLRDSKKCAVFASTLGVKVDNRIRYLEKVDMTRALILDACATEAIESICNEVEEGVRELARKDGLDINYRYSPGYGDLSIDIQPNILNVLSADKKIGLTCSESLILIPRKSVTAVIGFVEGNKKAVRNGCESCRNLNNCMYRRDGASCGN